MGFGLSGSLLVDLLTVVLLYNMFYTSSSYKISSAIVIALFQPSLNQFSRGKKYAVAPKNCNQVSL
jgi:hypothetical protein